MQLEITLRHRCSICIFSKNFFPKNASGELLLSFIRPGLVNEYRVILEIGVRILFDQRRPEREKVWPIYFKAHFLVSQKVIIFVSPMHCT